MPEPETALSPGGRVIMTVLKGHTFTSLLQPEANPGKLQ